MKKYAVFFVVFFLVFFITKNAFASGILGYGGSSGYVNINDYPITNIDVSGTAFIFETTASGIINDLEISASCSSFYGTCLPTTSRTFTLKRGILPDTLITTNCTATNTNENFGIHTQTGFPITYYQFTSHITGWAGSDCKTIMANARYTITTSNLSSQGDTSLLGGNYPYGIIYGLVSLPENAYITDILPANGSITGTTSVPVSFKYFLGANYALGDEIGVKIDLQRIDKPESQTFSFNGIYYDVLTALDHTFTLSTNTIWEVNFYFLRNTNNFINEYSLPGTTSRFSVVSDPTLIIENCDIINIAGCIQNALIYLFYPSNSSLTQFTGLYDKYKNKPPFGYIFAINTTLSGFNYSQNSAFALASMPVLDDYIFDPLRTGIAWILWVAFAFVFYHRIKNIKL